MRRELEQKLVERWPTWFDFDGDTRRTRMVDGFDCGDGWHEILLRLFTDLTPLAAEAERETGVSFEVLQVKQKFGTVRVHVKHRIDAILARVTQAQEESSRTCEICGQPGRLREGRWMRTRCDEHAAI